MNFLKCAFFTCLALNFSAPLVAAQSANELKCYELAGSPADVGLPPGISGTPFGEIDTVAAIEVCNEAWVYENIQEPRLAYTFGRAYHAAENYYEAETLYLVGSDLGFSLASYNYGVLFAEGLGVQKDVVKAYELYALSGSQGFLRGHRNAVQLIEDGSLGDPVWEKAGLHWRVLTSNGDAEAAFKLAEKIVAGAIKPADKDELSVTYRLAADGGHLQAARNYSKWLENHASDLRTALKYAYVAYDIAANADIATEEGWLIYEQETAKRVVDLVETTGLPVRDADELAMFQRDFHPDRMKSFTVPITCGEEEGIDFKIYVWDWSRDVPQTTEQAEWIEKARGCHFPDDVIESFSRLFAITQENEVSFVDLTEYAFSGDKETPAAQPSEPESRKHVDYDLGERIDTEHVASFTVSMECDGSVYTRKFSVYFGSNFLADEDFKAQVGATALLYSPCENSPENAKWADHTLERVIHFLDVGDEGRDSFYRSLSYSNMFVSEEPKIILAEECLDGIERFYQSEESEANLKVAREENGVATTGDLIELFQSDYVQLRDAYLSVTSQALLFVALPSEKVGYQKHLNRAFLAFSNCIEKPSGFPWSGAFVRFWEWKLEFDEWANKLIEGQVESAKFGHWKATTYGLFSVANTGSGKTSIAVLCSEAEGSGRQLSVHIEDSDPHPKNLVVDGISYDISTTTIARPFSEKLEMRPVETDAVRELISNLQKANQIFIEFADGSIIPLSARGSARAIDKAMGSCEA